MRQVILATFALLMVTFSVSLGHARGALPAEGAHVICRGHVITVIWVDAGGEEVKEVGLCGDAVLAFLDTSTPAALLGPGAERSQTLTIEAVPTRGSVAITARARAPPFAV